MVRIWRFHRHGLCPILDMGTLFLDQRARFQNSSYSTDLKEFILFLKFNMTIFIRNKWIYLKRNIDICAPEKFWFGFVELFFVNLKFIYTMMENNWNYSRRWWFSGRILACHAGDQGSIPRQRNSLLVFFNTAWIFVRDYFFNIYC